MQLIAFKNLGIKVEDVVAYTNEQVWTAAPARHLQQCVPDPHSGSALEYQARACTADVWLLQEEVPFAHTLPPYPVQRTPKWPPTFEQRKEVCGWQHQPTAPLLFVHVSALQPMHSAPGLPPQIIAIPVRPTLAGAAKAHTGVAASAARSAHISGDAILCGP